MNTDSKNDNDVLEIFIGEIPPFLLFEIRHQSLFHLLESHKDDQYFKPNPAAEPVFISIVAHFEAFCKHHFAALVNFQPNLIQNFASIRQEATLKLSHVIAIHDSIGKNLGSLVSENYDFGSPKLINGLFRDLIQVTPFSEADSKLFNTILMQRNHLVHHAGFHTLQYLTKHSLSEEIKNRAFRDSVKIDTEECHSVLEFLFEMAVKTTQVTVRKIISTVDYKYDGTDYNSRVINELLRGLHDFIDPDDTIR